MKIEELIEGIELKDLKAIEGQEIGKVSFKAKDEESDLFISLKQDAYQCMKDAKFAIENGAKMIVSEYLLDIDVPQIVVKDIRSAMSLMACNYYGHPSKNMKIIGITGTNGKTTSTYILKSILENAGHKVGLIGTNCNIIGNEVVPSTLTTPDPFELQKLFKDMHDSGCEYVVMEVSAHALYFHKVDGVYFESAIFTNLTQDHLDFFKDMQHYAQAKSQLFKKERCKNAIFNVDDEFGHIFARFCNCDRTISFALENPSDVFAVNLDVRLGGSNFFVNAMDDISEMHFNIGGKYNVYNVLGCVACAKALNIDMSMIVKGVQDVIAVEGRYNRYKSINGYNIIIDYAHSPDGLENILKSVKDLTDNRVITVFGCGGNRDATKRPIMGEIAGNMSDITIITSDNPRFENPNHIIDEIEKGIVKVTHNYLKIENRKNAIEYAMKIAKPGDTVVIAGKGQETYQDIKGVKTHFSDKKVVLETLEEEKSRKELQLQV